VTRHEKPTPLLYRVSDPFHGSFTECYIGVGRATSAKLRPEPHASADALRTFQDPRYSGFMVLDSVTCAPQRIRQPKQRDDVHDVYVFVCKCVIGSSRASQPLNILVYAFYSTSAFSIRLMPLRLAVGAATAFPGSSALALPSLSANQRAHPPHLPSSLVPPLYTSNMTT